MSTDWCSAAEDIADETFLSKRETEALLAYWDYRFPDGSLPRPKADVYEIIGEDLGIEPTTVRTYIARAEQKSSKALVTAKFVENPVTYLQEADRGGSLPEYAGRGEELPGEAKQLW